SSGPRSPRARRASAARACSRVISGCTSMNALRALAAMRARYSSASSSADASPCSSRAASVRNVSGPRLIARSLDDARDQVQAALDAGCHGLVVVAPLRLVDDVVAQPKAHVAGVRHRLDAARVDRLQPLDQAEHGVELAERALGLVVGQPDAGQHRDALDVVEGQGHGLAAGCAGGATAPGQAAEDRGPTAADHAKTAV